MANLSDAFGGFTLTAPTKEDCKKILTIFIKTLGKGDYCTVFELDRRLCNPVNLDDLDYSEEDGMVTVSCGFSATGRWAYSCNVERSPEIIEYYASEEEIQYLESIFWSATYDFTDYEPGCGVLYTSVYEVTHEANAKLKKCQILEKESTSYDPTWKNIMDLMCMSIQDLLEERGALDVLPCEDDEDDENGEVMYYTDDLLEFIQDISKYRKCSLEDVVEFYSEQTSDFGKLVEIAKKVDPDFTKAFEKQDD